VKTGGDPKYLAKCGKSFNGEVATKTGGETYNDKSHKDLDTARKGSKAGLLLKKNPG